MNDFSVKFDQNLENPVIVGRIARPIGVKGEVKVYADSSHPERMLEFEHLIISTPNGYLKLKVCACVRTGGCFRVSLEGIDTPEQAAEFSGCEIVISGRDKPTLLDGEYYVDDLVGCRAVDDGGTEIGLLREVWHQDHHDIWVIDGYGEEILVPAVKEFILDVDLQQHRVTIKRVKGLWGEG